MQGENEWIGVVTASRNNEEGWWEKKKQPKGNFRQCRSKCWNASPCDVESRNVNEFKKQLDPAIVTGRLFEGSGEDTAEL